MTLDGVPYIGQYSRHTENLYVATGFNKWGMTSSMGCGHDPAGPDHRSGLAMRGGFFPIQKHPAPAAGGQRLHIGFESSDPYRPPLPSPGLRPKVERAGALLGLPLPRFPLCRGRHVAGQSGNRGSQAERGRNFQAKARRLIALCPCPGIYCDVMTGGAEHDHASHCN